MPLDESGEIIDRLLTAVQDEELSDVAFEALSSMVSDHLVPAIKPGYVGIRNIVRNNQFSSSTPKNMYCFHENK